MPSSSNEVTVHVAPHMQTAPTTPLPIPTPSTLEKLASPSSKFVSTSEEAVRAYRLELGNFQPRFEPGSFGAMAGDDDALPLACSSREV